MQVKPRVFDQNLLRGQCVWPLGHILTLFQWHSSFSSGNTFLNYPWGPCVPSQLWQPSQHMIGQVKKCFKLIKAYILYCSSALPTSSSTSGSASSPFATINLFSSRSLSVARDMAYFFILWHTCSASSAAIMAGLNTGIVMVSSQSQVWNIMLCINISPNAFEKRKDLDAYRTRLIVNSLVPSASQSRVRVYVWKNVCGYSSDICNHSSTHISRLCKEQQMWG